MSDRPGRVRSVDDFGSQNFRQALFICVKPSNQDQDFEHIVEHRTGRTIENAGGRYSQLAVQGPKARCGHFCKPHQRAARFHRVTTTYVLVTWHGVDCLIARTGYTGKTAFEKFISCRNIRKKMWSDLMDAGAEGV